MAAVMAFTQWQMGPARRDQPLHNTHEQRLGEAKRRYHSRAGNQQQKERRETKRGRPVLYITNTDTHPAPFGVFENEKGERW